MKRLFTSITRPRFWFLFDIGFLTWDIVWFTRGVLTHNVLDIVVCGVCAIVMAFFAEKDWRLMHP